MDPIERKLIKRLKNSEPDSFTVFFERYSGKIYNLAFRMCGNREDADDIVQETFILAFLKMDAFREESSVYTWLYTIAKNLCLRRLENREKSHYSSLDKLLHKVLLHENQNVFSVVERQYYVNQVKDGCLLGLLKCLSFYQRIAFILNILLDVKVRDISIILDKSEPATRMLIHHAKQNIRGFLCKNCSLYNSGNPCRCENLINFSLQKGWIHKFEDGELHKIQITPLEIEREISDLKKVTLLYHSLEDRQPSEKIIHIIKEKINKQESHIFNPKKVK